MNATRAGEECLWRLTFELSRTRRNDARARQKENVPTLLAGPGGMPLGLGLNEGLDRTRAPGRLV